MTAQRDYDIIVVGGGHAGCEAALAAARLGASTLLLTSNFDSIALMPCNPAIGGLAKGHLVKEIDMLGGEMGRVTDRTAIQYRKLNTTKGAAVQSTRAQVDKHKYKTEMRRVLMTEPRLTIREDMAVGLLVSDGAVVGVTTRMGEEISARATVLACGTFLNGVCHVGLYNFKAGRMNDFSAVGLSDYLVSLGFSIGRLKTGTVPRLDARSIDFSVLEAQPGDNEPLRFSYVFDEPQLPQISCYITHTNEGTHEHVRAGIDRSPLFSGRIKGIGPRYCPSIEDKVFRFPDRDRHQLFLEPEGLDTNEVYVNGLSTSLPKDVQERMVASLKGCEQAKIIKYGYAVEYDYIVPTQLYPWLETRLLKDLYICGQLNGTSGYEEAAAQGFMAGLNAAMNISGRENVVLGRDQAYTGVLIDDLITKGTEEPYRMFTSRAEHRLLLREDNLAERLIPLAEKIGIVHASYRSAYAREKALHEEAVAVLRGHMVYPNAQVNEHLANLGSAPLKNPCSLYDLLKRTEVHRDNLATFLPGFAADGVVLERIEIESKYEGYIKKEHEEVRKFADIDRIVIPTALRYDDIPGLSNEVRDKLKKISPYTLGQASRISGVTPAAISILMVNMKVLAQRGKAQDTKNSA